MLPDFLCIGAPRTGTSWLHVNLRKHPRVWVPPVKEIHYFDSPDSSLWARLTKPGVIQHGLRARLVRDLGRALRGDRRNDLLWLARYVLLSRGDRWYAGLFPGGGSLKIGEVTPTYAQIPEDRIAAMHRLMPDAKIVYFLRNPIDLAWSLTVRPGVLKREGAVEARHREHVIGELTRPELRDMTDYAAILERWERYYDPDQIMVAFYEDLAADPAVFYRRILDFLDLDGVAEDEIIVEAVHTSGHDADPVPFHPAMAPAYRGNIDRAHRRFGNEHTARWQEMCAAILRDHPVDATP